VQTQQEPLSQQEQLHSPERIQQEQLQQSCSQADESMANDTTNDFILRSNGIGNDSEEYVVMSNEDIPEDNTVSQLSL